MTPQDKARRMAELTHIADVRRDGELARLALAATRLRAAEALLANLRTAIDRETRSATLSGEVPALAALERHLLMARQVCDTLEDRVARLGTDCAAARQAAALAFGRALVLRRMCAAGTGRRPIR